MADSAPARSDVGSREDVPRSKAREGSPVSVRSDDGALQLPAERVVSSGVAFYPPSKQLWRIGGKWYDFEPFLKLHPGGAEVVRLARDRFEDSTYAFESHHHNYKRARAVIAKYEVPAPSVLYARPAGAAVPGAGGDGAVGAPPQLLGDDAFYSVCRQRLASHLRSVGCPTGGPTTECVVWFWGSVTAWAATWVLMWYTGSVLAAVAYGIATSILGAFGHNWVHQPRYRTWAYLSLDTVGFSSSAWYREHLLQHHMYTNTPWDNHFRGTEPFLVTDPTVKRTWFQGRIMPYLNPLILTLGLYGNWFDHAVATLKGQEAIRPTELILPTNIALIVMRHGFLHGALLTYTWSALLGLWYFSMALMNHNAEHCMDVDARNAARDWGEAQLHSCADWGVALPFHKAWIYLWLNYHTVHHLFPRLDFAHHPAAQAILMRTCQEHHVKYVAADSPVEIYRQMVRSFATPQSLYKALMVYTGDL